MSNAAQTNVSDLDALSAILASLDETPAAADTQMKGIDSLLDELETNAAEAATSTPESIVAKIENELPVTPAAASGDMEQVIIDLEESNTATPPEKSTEILAGGEENILPVIEEPAAPEVQKEKQPEPKPKKASTPRGARFTFDGKDDAFFEKAGLQREVFMKCYNEAPVKAMDKIQNIMHWFSGGPDLSVYTRISLHSLIADKTASSNSLKLAMMSYPEKPYPVGTASTQAGQMMAVFPALGIAAKDGKSLTLNADSPIVKKFMAEE
ncbi:MULTISPECIES: hypothetical protein [Enterobacter cloacae complex]|uniref:hypothetical protein n=1 Tax=Enterobacter cloacae complex TaxID=354276 RepID=UPI00202225AD|nr:MULTISPECIES: hypothetical protein [Enterobacter cloacae complex]MCL8169822.1 hypothetical protein [Enterobacter kobei]MCM7426317.1 hypothetical protein [Enterobacter chengduensis]MCM7797467.1 hypothetical protein [Enterobacter kobei]MDV1944001.1 hypothetical protein [Enterobacter kobei]